MNIKNCIARSLVILSVTLALGVVAVADTIRLRDGSVLRGKVVSYNQRQFTIIVYIGTSQSRHVISVDEIESVEFDGGDAMGRAEAQGGAAPPTGESIARNRGGSARELPQPAETPIPSNPPPDTPVTADQPVTEPDAGAVPVIAEKTVSVAAAADWTSTEIRVQRGQRIVISATGDVDLGDGQRSDPAGLASLTSKQMMKNRPIGALIAVIGDDNDEFVFIGRSSEFTAKSNGILFLTINDDSVKDNAGAYIARVRVLSNR